MKKSQINDRRTDSGFIAEAYEGIDAVVPLADIQLELPLDHLYERMELTPV